MTAAYGSESPSLVNQHTPQLADAVVPFQHALSGAQALEKFAVSFSMLIHKRLTRLMSTFRCARR